MTRSHTVDVPVGTAAGGLARAPGWPARAAAALRHRIWRAVFSAAAHGVRVTGSVPTGGVVVVANHASHADTAALLAALPAASAPVTAAAADHWFRSPWRALVCRGLTAGRPVRRGGGGWQDLLAFVPLLRSGRAVIVFAEGTRSRDGAVGPFHSGAFRLAALAGVPVLPVALVGTAEVLPLAGRVRARPVEVRFGTPIHPGTADAAGRARDQVIRLLGLGAARPAVARSCRLLATLAAAPAGVLMAFGWGLAEAVSWPLMAELLLMVLVPAAPRHWWRLAAALAAGSVVGVLAHAVATRCGWFAPTPLTTVRMQATAAAQLRSEGARAVLSQWHNGIPIKVYAAEAGVQHLPLLSLAGWTVLVRSLRIFAVGAILALLGTLGRRVVRSGYGLYLSLLAIGFPLVLSQIIASWQ